MKRITKCAACHKNERVFLWQPCGPANDWNLFMFPGWHYRGFSSVPICDECRKKIQSNTEPVTFRAYKKVFVFYNGTIKETTENA